MIRNASELIQLHKEMTEVARITLANKNHDYAGAGDDPFANFHTWGLLGIAVRMDDKMARLRTFIKKGELKVNDESVRDTLLDLINYSVLFQGYLMRGDNELLSQSGKHTAASDWDSQRDCTDVKPTRTSERPRGLSQGRE